MSTGVTLEHEAAAVGLQGDDLAVARAGQKFRVDANSRNGILEQQGDFPLVHDGAGAWLITAQDVVRANFVTLRIETTLDHCVAKWKLTAPALARIIEANRKLSAIAKAPKVCDAGGPARCVGVAPAASPAGWVLVPAGSERAMPAAILGCACVTGSSGGSTAGGVPSSGWDL